MKDDSFLNISRVAAFELVEKLFQIGFIVLIALSLVIISRNSTAGVISLFIGGGFFAIAFYLWKIACQMLLIVLEAFENYTKSTAKN